MRPCYALIPLALTLAGCQFYWTRPNATFDEFANDHRACVRAVGVSSGPRYEGAMPKSEAIGRGERVATGIILSPIVGIPAAAAVASTTGDDKERVGKEPAGPDVVIVLPELYRECLKAHGWRRVEDGGTYTEPGRFRGIERESAVRLDSVPERIPWYETTPSECRDRNRVASDLALRSRCNR